MFCNSENFYVLFVFIRFQSEAKVIEAETNFEMRFKVKSLLKFWYLGQKSKLPKQSWKQRTPPSDHRDQYNLTKSKPRLPGKQNYYSTGSW